MAEKFINIRFPFKDSPKGFFVDLTKTSDDAIKSDLVHLLLTKKGDRLYLPDFGTNLMRFIFEQNDEITHSKIRQEIEEVVGKYMPNLRIDNVNVEQSDSNEHEVIIRIDYTVTDDVFEKRDFVILEI